MTTGHPHPVSRSRASARRIAPTVSDPADSRRAVGSAITRRQADRRERPARPRRILGISPASGLLKYGLAMGLFAWVALTAAVIVGMFLGLGGNAGSGMKVHGAELEDLMALVPWAWLLALLAWLGFFAAARRRRQPDPPDRQ